MDENWCEGEHFLKNIESIAIGIVKIPRRIFFC